MSDCQDTNFVRQIEVYNVIGEALYADPASGQIGRNIWNWRSGFRETDDSIDSNRNRIEKALAQSGLLPLIPPGRILQLATGFRFRE